MRPGAKVRADQTAGASRRRASRGARTGLAPALVALGLTLAWPAWTCAQAGDPQVGPAVSLVDYLEAKRRPSDRAARRKLFEELVGERGYTGTAPQNIRLLTLLLERDPAARDACKAALEELARVASDRRPADEDEREVLRRTPIPRFVLAEGLGAQASYGVEVRVRARKGKVPDAGFAVTVGTAATRLGPLAVTGQVEVFVGDGERPALSAKLVPPWFLEIMAAETEDAFLFMEPEKSFDVPRGKRVVARVRVFPTIETARGVVPLGGAEVEVVLQE